MSVHTMKKIVDRRAKSLRRPAVLRPLLAVAVLIGFAVTASDPRAVERDPYHNHIVVGGDPLQQARVLADHLHHMFGPASARADKAPASARAASNSAPRAQGLLDAVCALHPDTGSPDVHAVQAAKALGVSLFGAGGGALLASPWVVLPSTQQIASFASVLPGRPAGAALPVPEPPPRAS